MKFKFFKKRTPKEYQAVSLSSLTWKKFKKESQGMVSIIYIGIVIVIAILGYLITPDDSPYCNRQQLEIAIRKPGFKVEMLQKKQDREIKKENFLRRMLFGQPPLYQLVPIEKWHQRGDSLYVLLFEQSDMEDYIAYSLTDLKSVEPVKTYHFPLGTDRYGRDVLSQLMMGSRVSISVGFISVFIALVIGILVGSIAGFYRGKVDDILLYLINVVWSIPTLLLVIAISFALGKGFWQIFIAIGLTMWVDVARVVRGQTISLREKDFIEAGKALGFNNFHLIFKHILPNLWGTIVVIAASNFSSAILMEAGLSFLGIGVQPPMPSWGTMIKENYAYIVLDNAYLAIIPGLAIMSLVLAFMLMGSALRNAMDVKS